MLATQAGLKFVLRSPSPCYWDRDGCDASSAASPLASVSWTLESFVLTSLQSLTVIVHCFFEPSERSIIGDYV